MHRRGFLALASLALSLPGCSDKRVLSGQAPVIVLVHGALHGGWCWRRVAKLLRDAGAEVFTPTLTGLGERAHLNGPHVGLQTHIQDVIGCIEAEELERVVLVGHSYAGMVITGVADRLGDRISHLVYLDAVVPRSGETALNAMGNLEIGPEVTMFLAKPDTDFGVTDPADRAWIQRRITRQSAQTLREPLVVERDLSAMKRTYIACTSGADPALALMRRTTQERIDVTWRTKKIATGHDAMVTAPRAVADTLLETAEA